jgi:putative heme utilization carrier protein HutX
VHTEDLILEAKGSVPKGKSARGFYNLHGAPIGGHLKGENCDAIAFVSRPLFSSDTKSVQFFNKKGGCMFKIYLGRDENRQMLSSQIEAFEALKNKLGSS